MAVRLRVTKQTVGKWRKRFLERRLDGLLDEPRPGAPRKHDDARIEQLIAATLNERPREATHWSTRLLAKTLELERAIRQYLDTYNENPTPFIWTKTADHILASVARFCQRISDSGH